MILGRVGTATVGTSSFAKRAAAKTVVMMLAFSAEAMVAHNGQKIAVANAGRPGGAGVAKRFAVVVVRLAIGTLVARVSHTHGSKTESIHQD